MPELSEIPIKELLFDRQEAYNDLLVAYIAKQTGVAVGDSDRRVRGNLQTINVIDAECKRRGFDPAIYEEVAKALKE